MLDFEVIITSVGANVCLEIVPKKGFHVKKMRLGETKEFNASDGFDNGKEDDFFCKGCECGNWHTKEVTDQLSMQEF